jgi:hypothetical protein
VHRRGRQRPVKKTPPPPVRPDVAPILDKKGCSVAGCHGKFGGRGGFAISLLTLSPWDDYDPIVRGAKGRRVNFAEPEKSLLLLKATGVYRAWGGARFESRIAGVPDDPPLDRRRGTVPPWTTTRN